MAKFVCRTTNRNLLQAMMAELNILGYRTDTDHNRNYMLNPERATTIIVYSDNEARYYNHTGSEDNTIFDLPAQWDEAILAAKGEAEINIGGHKATFSAGAVHFGCQTLTREDLNSYLKLLSEPIGATIVIKGTVIDVHLVAALLRKIEQKNSKWKVGDALPNHILCSSTPRLFWGYEGNEWESKTNNYFSGDRVIEEIEVKNGKKAALISGTLDVWIALESLPKE
jgi:hypothetical protein